MAEDFDFRDITPVPVREDTAEGDWTEKAQQQRTAIAAMISGGSSDTGLPSVSVTKTADASPLTQGSGTDSNPMRVMASTAESRPDAPPAPTEKQALNVTDKQDAAKVANIATQLKEKDTLDVKSLTELLQKYTKGAADPRQEAQKVLDDIGAQSWYKLTIQGNGNNTMVYKQVKNPLDRDHQGKSELIPLPGVNIPRPKHPFGNGF